MNSSETSFSARIPGRYLVETLVTNFVAHSLVRAACRRFAAGFLGWVLCSAAAHAHDVLAEFVQHDVKLEVKSEHLDLTIELTLFEEASDAERRRMDVNRDGRIQRAEIEAYTRALPERLGNDLTLKLGDQPLALTALHAPELDLLGDDRVHQSHHRLRLAYFCSTPADLKPGSVLSLESRLWPEWPAVVSVSAAGNSYELRAEKPAAPLMKRLGQEETRRFKWVLTGVPPAKPKASEPPAPEKP